LFHWRKKENYCQKPSQYEPTPDSPLTLQKTAHPLSAEIQAATWRVHGFQDLWDEKRQAKKALFGFVLWTFAETAITLMPIVRTMRTGTSIMAQQTSRLLSLAVLVIIAMTWGGIVIDQTPCFLGMPNCD
jgi:hypothetical protein